jgi:hypothetical protein
MCAPASLIGSIEVDGLELPPLPVLCDRECLLETVGDNAAILATELSDALALKLEGFIGAPDDAAMRDVADAATGVVTGGPAIATAPAAPVTDAECGGLPTAFRDPLRRLRHHRGRRVGGVHERLFLSPERAAGACLRAARSSTGTRPAWTARGSTATATDAGAHGRRGAGPPGRKRFVVTKVATADTGGRDPFSRTLSAARRSRSAGARGPQAPGAGPSAPRTGSTHPVRGGPARRGRS